MKNIWNGEWKCEFIEIHMKAIYLLLQFCECLWVSTFFRSFDIYFGEAAFLQYFCNFCFSRKKNTDIDGHNFPLSIHLFSALFSLVILLLLFFGLCLRKIYSTYAHSFDFRFLCWKKAKQNQFDISNIFSVSGIAWDYAMRCGMYWTNGAKWFQSDFAQ